MPPSQTRYEYADDIVPHLPPSASMLEILQRLPFLGQRLSGLERYDYARVGQLTYITSDYQLVPDPNNSLLNDRRLHILKLVVAGHIQQIGDDHRIACGYGYMTALCPTGVCPGPVGTTA
jgi:hypothetical protein